MTSNDSGEIFECKHEEEMIAYMTNSDLSRQQQSINTLFMTKPLVDIYGYLAEDKFAQSVINGTFQPPAKTRQSLS